MAGVPIAFSEVLNVSINDIDEVKISTLELVATAICRLVLGWLECNIYELTLDGLVFLTADVNDGEIVDRLVC